MPMISSASPEALRRYARGAHAAHAHLEPESRLLDAALASAMRSCREYPVPSLAGLAARLLAGARATGELGAWVEGVAAVYQAADAGPGPSPGAPESSADVPLHEVLLWNALGVYLLGPLTSLELAARYEPLLVGLTPLLVTALGPHLAVCGLGVAALSLAGEGPGLAVDALQDPASLPKLLEHGVWGRGFDSLNPYLRRALGARLDALNLTLAALADEVAGKAGAAALPPPSSTVYGAFAAISYRAGEQVVLERLNGEGDYRVSITGLDPTKPGAANNFEAVMITDAFSAAENPYYREVRERFFAALRQIPPGSELHLQGHSMGGGMCLLLREDPEVRRRLREAHITVPSMTIYGAVVPAHAHLALDLPDGEAFADTELRAYVHTNDALALNVGAGYAGYPAVQMIGGPALDAPNHAHGDYANPDHYAGISPELLELPYVVDPEAYERSVPVAPPLPPPLWLDEPLAPLYP